MSKLLGVISIVIPSALLLLIINFLFDIVHLNKIQGLPIFLPLFVSPVGAIIGFIAYKFERLKLSLVGIIFNLILFILFPFVFMIIGTLIFGV